MRRNTLVHGSIPKAPSRGRIRTPTRGHDELPRQHGNERTGTKTCCVRLTRPLVGAVLQQTGRGVAPKVTPAETRPAECRVVPDSQVGSVAMTGSPALPGLPDGATRSLPSSLPSGLALAPEHVRVAPSVCVCDGTPVPEIQTRLTRAVVTLSVPPDLNWGSDHWKSPGAAWGQQGEGRSEYA
jgi:hypothetical protein